MMISTILFKHAKQLQYYGNYALRNFGAAKPNNRPKIMSDDGDGLALSAKPPPSCVALPHRLTKSLG